MHSFKKITFNFLEKKKNWNHAKWPSFLQSIFDVVFNSLWTRKWLECILIILLEIQGSRAIYSEPRCGDFLMWFVMEMLKSILGRISNSIWWGNENCFEEMFFDCRQSSSLYCFRFKILSTSRNFLDEILLMCLIICLRNFLTFLWNF